MEKFILILFVEVVSALVADDCGFVLMGRNVELGPLHLGRFLLQEAVGLVLKVQILHVDVTPHFLECNCFVKPAVRFPHQRVFGALLDIVVAPHFLALVV